LHAPAIVVLKNLPTINQNKFLTPIKRKYRNSPYTYLRF
jgi:hypothetical protein